MTKELRPIRTEEDHENVLAEIWRLMAAEPEPGSADGDRLEVLAVLSEAYEAEHHPIAPPDPVEAIEFMMEQKGIGRSDLALALGGRGRVSEVLNRKRPLSITMIRGLVPLLGIPAEILVRPYRLAPDAASRGVRDVPPSQSYGAIAKPTPSAARARAQAGSGYASAGFYKGTKTAASAKAAPSGKPTAVKKVGSHGTATAKGGTAKRSTASSSGRPGKPTSTRSTNSKRSR